MRAILFWVGLQFLSRGLREGVCPLSWKQGGAFSDTEFADALILESKTLQNSDQHILIADK